ncbi:hypothetical protein D3C86_1632920 [compost metagenome]
MIADQMRSAFITFPMRLDMMNLRVPDAIDHNRQTIPGDLTDVVVAHGDQRFAHFDETVGDNWYVHHKIPSRVKTPTVAIAAKATSQKTIIIRTRRTISGHRLRLRHR